MARHHRKPLSEDEIKFLKRLANGNALALQRRRDKQAQRQRPRHRPEE